MNLNSYFNLHILTKNTISYYGVTNDIGSIMEPIFRSKDLYVVTKLNNFVRYELDSDIPFITYTKDICDSTWMHVHDAITSATISNYYRNPSRIIFNIFCIDDHTNNQNSKFQKFITVKLLNYTFQKFIYPESWTPSCTKSFKLNLGNLTKEHSAEPKLIYYRYIGFSVQDDIICNIAGIVMSQNEMKIACQQIVAFFIKDTRTLIDLKIIGDMIMVYDRFENIIL